MSKYNTFINICSIISNLAIFITMLIAIVTYMQNKKNVKAELDWQRKKETIVFANKILTKTDNLLFKLEEYLKDGTSGLQEMENSELNKIILSYLSLMERLSVGLNTNVYDLDVYARICCSKTIKAWDKLENIIHQKRRKGNNELLYKEFENVVKKLHEWKTPLPIEKRGNYEPLD